MTPTNAPGLSHVGRERELKRLVESYLEAEIVDFELEDAARDLRLDELRHRAAHGVEVIPSNDFSLHDPVLDLAHATGAHPDLAEHGELSPREEYFLLAFGKTPSGKSGRALETTTWCGTNERSLVPEIGEGTRLGLRFNRARRAYQEALAWGIRTRPVLVGPVSFLLLARNPDPRGAAPLTRLEEWLGVYGRILRELAEAGADWVQLDEPCLALDPTDDARRAYERAYAFLATHDVPKIVLTASRGVVASELGWIRELPVAALEFDRARSPA